jgi:hypothetical protein
VRRARAVTGARGEAPRPPLHRRGGRRTGAFLALALVLVSGCAHSGGGAQARGQDRNVLTEAEIQEWRATGISTAWDLVERARPRWLGSARIQSVHTPTTVMVYLGNTSLGQVDQLRGIPLDLVREIRWLGAAEAGMLPGGGASHVEGAIVIQPREGR